MTVRTGFLATAIIAACWSVVAASDALAAEQDPGVAAYHEARALLVEGRVAEAAARFESLISAYPDSSRADDAAFYLAYCRHRLGQKHLAFTQYVSFLERYPRSILARRGLMFAIGLAQELRRDDGDIYDQFLARYVRRGQSFTSRVEIAIRLAQLGNWSGLDLLVRGLERGSGIQQIVISDLLRYRLDEESVRGAFERALRGSANEIVRMKAASALSRVTHLDSVREAMSEAMLHDRNELVRISAAEALSHHRADRAVQRAFNSALGSERDPIVLINVIESLGDGLADVGVHAQLLSRLSNEEDPMIRFAVTGALRGHVVIDSDTLPGLETLVHAPEPLVRLNTIRVLAQRTDDPQVRVVILESLENDPNIDVRMAAVSVLAPHASNERVRRVLELTVENSESVSLITSSIRALGSQAAHAEVRRMLAGMLSAPQPPVVSYDLVRVLAPYSDRPEVQDGFIFLLENAEDGNLRHVVARSLRAVEGESRLERLERLYLEEEDVELAALYLELIARADPERGRALGEGSLR